jgi:hypothetical protein
MKTRIHIGRGATAGTIVIDTARKCNECGKAGSTPNRLCIGCTAKALGEFPMKSAAGKAVQQRFKDALARKPACNPVWEQ